MESEQQIGSIAKPGDLVVFSGSGFLSESIRIWTRSQASHCGVIVDSAGIVDPVGEPLGYLCESTIANGKDGVRIDKLSLRVDQYDLGRPIWLLSLRDSVRDDLDIGAMMTWIMGVVDRDHYNKLELGEFLLRKFPVIGWLPWIYKPVVGKEICSELVADAWKAGGMYGLKPSEMAPRDLIALNIYGACTQLAGKPTELRGVNIL